MVLAASSASFMGTNVWAANASPVPVTVFEDSGRARREVVSVGVPFSRDDGVTDPQRLHVVDPKGAEVAVQVLVLSRWDAPPEDAAAPIRIARVRFPAEVGGHATARYEVRVGDPRPAATVPALATAKEGRISVDTGAFATTIDVDDPGPVTLAFAAPKGAPVPVPRAQRVEIAENGPLEAVVLVHGEATRGYAEKGGEHPFVWTERWRFRKGMPGAELEVTVENPDRMFEHPYNDKGEPRGKSVSSFVVTWTRAAPRRAKAYVDGVVPRAGELSLLQDGPDAFTVRTRGRTLRKGARAAGWVASGEAALAVQAFWQNAPSGLAAREGSLSAVLLRGGREPVFFQGSRAKTWELSLRRGKDVASLAAEALSPLRAVVSPQALQDSLAIGPISVRDDAAWPDLEKTIDGIDGPAAKARGKALENERDAEAAYGWLDYGDSMRAGSKSARIFGNSEFDFGLVLLRAYLRDPRHPRELRDAAHAALRHLADVDVMHTDDDNDWASHGVHKHDSGNDREHVHAPDFSHFWVRGLLTAWLLDGDDRAHDVAVNDIARWIEERERPAGSGTYVWADELRDVGWLLVAMDDFYEATGDARWLDRAKRLVHATVMPNVDAEGTMRNAAFVTQKDWFPPWQQAYVADGLGRYCIASRRRGTPDEAAEEKLRNMLDYFSSDAPWIRTPVTLYGRTYPETLAFEITPARKDADEASMTQTLADPFVWGWMLGHNEPDRREALRAIANVFPSGPEIYFDPSIHTPAKSAAVRLYFGDAARWLEQTTAHARAQR